MRLRSFLFLIKSNFCVQFILLLRLLPGPPFLKGVVLAYPSVALNCSEWGLRLVTFGRFAGNERCSPCSNSWSMTARSPRATALVDRK